MLSKLLLEAPWRMVILWVAVQFIVIAIWSYRRTDRCRRAVWIGFVLLPILLSISVFVITPRERIIALCKSLAVMAERGDSAAIISYLDDDCRISRSEPGECADRIGNALTRYRVTNVRLRRFEVSTEGSDTVVATFSSICTVYGTDGFDRDIFLKWRLGLRVDDTAISIRSIDAAPGLSSNFWDLDP